MRSASGNTLKESRSSVGYLVRFARRHNQPRKKKIVTSLPVRYEFCAGSFISSLTTLSLRAKVTTLMPAS